LKIEGRVSLWLAVIREKNYTMKTQLRSLLAGCVLACSPAFAQTATTTQSTNNVLLCTPPVAEENQSLCSGSKVGDIMAETNEGAIVQWYYVGFVTQPVALTDNVTDGRYTVTQTVDGCTSQATTVFVSILISPEEPTGEALQTFTTGETLAALEVTTETGNSIKWYTRNEALEYTAAESTTALVNGVTYYAAQFNGTCESAYLAITVSEILSTGNAVLKNISLYPNPATSTVTINSNDVISQITVSNLLGQRVLSLTNNAAVASVNMASLPTGTYAVQVYTAKGNATVKVIKQ